MNTRMSKRRQTGWALLLGLLLWSPVQAAVDPWSESYRLEKLADYGAAIDALKPVLDANSNNEFAHLRRGWLHYLQEKHGEAIRDYEHALTLNPKSIDAQLGLTLPLLAQRRWREAASHANRVLEVAPWNYYAHLRLMVSEEGERKWETLARHATEVYRRYPSDATVLVYLARANAQLKNTEAARSAYRRVLQRVPGHVEAMQYLIGEN